MTDSDSDDLLTNNVCTFQNRSTIVSAKGPNIDMNITGLSFRNNVFSSTMQMPLPFERQRYAASSYDQRSLSNRRELSPFSARSTCDTRQMNYDYSFNPRSNGARSVFNGRSGSPMSVRTTDTCTSVSAIDIVQAINNEQFNEKELMFIKQQIGNKLSRHQSRNKIYRRPYRKIKRHRSGYDSGELGSNSSLSDDNRSTVTSNYRNNMSSSRSAITDISNFRRKLKTSHMFQDRTDNFRFNPVRNAPRGQMSWNTTQTSINPCQNMQARANMSSAKNMPVPANFNIIQEKSAPLMLQKDRFKSGFSNQSQRFNKSTIPTSIPESVENEFHKRIHSNKNNRNNIETDSDDDNNIFSNNTTQKQTNNVNKKRSMDNEDTFQPIQKRFKALSPCKNNIETQKPKACNGKTNDFIFAKPACPVRKSVKEKLISKCAAPLTDNPPVISVRPPEIEQTNQEKLVEEETEKLEDESNSSSNSTNLSMRPSFIKRKLFTQKLDITEARNLSTESLDSPQNSVYGAFQKEKPKARKLQQATTQSCLSRDIEKDENNLLDLIQKIVPIDQMNVTNQTNKTASQSKNISQEDEKWDAISTNYPRNNDGNESDTYTDEEILNSTVKELQKSCTKTNDKVKEDTPKKVPAVRTKSCQIVLEKLPAKLGSKEAIIKSFWDTDFESDAEFVASPKIDKTSTKENRRPDTVVSKEPPKTQKCLSHFSSKRPVSASVSSQKYTFDTTQNWNSTLRIRSHKDPKRNKHDHTTVDTKSTLINNTERKQERNQVINCISNKRPEEITKIESKKPEEKTRKGTEGKKNQNMNNVTEKDKKSPKSKNREESATRKGNKNSPKGKKQDTSINKQKKSPKGKIHKETTTKKDKNSPKEKNKESKTDKQNKYPQKPVKNKYDDANIQDKSKKAGIKLKNTLQKPNNISKENDVENNTQNKKPNVKNNLVEPKEGSNKTKKTTQRNNSSIIEENNNTTLRTRSRSRTNANNQTTDNTNVKETINQSLRSSRLNLSNINDKKTRQRDKITAEQNILAKRAVKKITNPRLLTDESDLSFSLTPTPRKTRSASRNNTLNSTPFNKTFSQTMNLPISDIKHNRRRLPNKRYLF